MQNQASPLYSLPVLCSCGRALCAHQRLQMRQQQRGVQQPALLNLFLHLLQEGCYAAFINRVRDNLHVVLAMSPVGDVFRARCRKFPSLINCCTIDWFTEWPPDALLSVSMKFLGPVELGSDQVKAAICSMCADIHTSVSTASERFHAQLRRR